MVPALYWDIMQCRVVIPYGCVGTAYWSHLQVPRIQKVFGFLALEHGTDRLS